MVYYLKLPPAIRRLHPMFNIVKLTTISNNLILSKHLIPLPNPILIDRQEEWEVEKVLNSQ